MTGLSPWRLAWHLARYRPWALLFSFAFFVAASSAMLPVGWLLGKIFDGLSGGQHDGLGIYPIIAGLAGVELARIAASWAGVLRSLYWEQLRGLLRLNLLRAQLASGGPEAASPTATPGEAVSRFRDDADDFLAFGEIAVFVAGELLFAVGSIVIMLSIDPLITIAVVAPLVTVVFTTRLVSGQIRRRRVDHRRASAEATGWLGDLFGAVLTVKTTGASGGFLDRLTELNERRRRAGLRDQLVTQLLDTVSRTSVDLSIGLVLLLAVPAMHHGAFSVGDLALFASYAGTLVAMPRYTGRLLARHRQAGVAVERMATLLPPRSGTALVTHRPLSDRPQPAPTVLHHPLRTLEVCGLTAVHPGTGRGVREVNLTLERGTVTVITGPAGAGKTTLLRALLGLVPAQAGELRWNGEPVGDRAAFLVPPRSAYVPQVPRLLSESLRDNLLLGADDAGLAAAVCTSVLDADVAAMPDGLATRLGARGMRLSGGQAQRAAIARALVRRTDLLVLDDVSSALDGHTEEQLWNGLLARGEHTLLVVSNRPATIARADQVIQLEQGRASFGVFPVQPCGDAGHSILPCAYRNTALVVAGLGSLLVAARFGVIAAVTAR